MWHLLFSVAAARGSRVGGQQGLVPQGLCTAVQVPRCVKWNQSHVRVGQGRMAVRPATGNFSAERYFHMHYLL